MVPVLLLLLALAAVAAGLLFPALQQVAWLAIPLGLAAAWLWLRQSRRKANQRWIVIDGSNVLYWNENTPRIETVRAVVDRLTALGYTPGVIFDANAGYLIAGRYEHDATLGRRLGLPEDRVMVMPKGNPADPAILESARDLGALIVTNDRYRDWAETFPEVKEPARFIRGGFRADGLWLDLPAPASAD